MNYLHANQKESCSTIASRIVSRHRPLCTLHWLYDHYRDACDLDEIETCAMECRREDVLQ
uniref:Uncharacterized protein n=1 Tax=Globisporangium ultimum (strain ATCC 200006 / CBS 805.95 / DAOM BR144) TaxID=431595 RepID=K3WE48_GLOUD